MIRKSLLQFSMSLIFSCLAIVPAWAQFKPTGGPSGEYVGRSAIAWGDTAFVSANGYCLRTTDGGAHWVKLTNGLGVFPQRVSPYCFAKLGNTLYMGTNRNNEVFYTKDWGETWVHYNDSLPPVAVPTYSVTSGDRVFLAGTGLFNLSYTTAENTGWKATTLGGAVSAMSVLGKDTIWVNMSGKTFYTHNNGDSWTQIVKEPLSGFGLSSTDFVKAGSRIIAVTNGGGVNTTYYSDNYGDSWTLANKGFASGTRLIRINDDEIYATGFKELAGSVIRSAVYKTTNRGEDWEAVTTLNGSAPTMERWKDNDLLIPTTGGVMSVTQGSTTSSLVPLPFTNVRAFASFNNKLYAVSSLGMHTRNASGGSWSDATSLASYYNTYVNNMRVFDGKLYLCTDKGVFVSDDGNAFTPVAGLEEKNISDYFVNGNLKLAAKTTINNTFGIITLKTDTVFYSSGGAWSASALNTSTSTFPTFAASGFTQHSSKLFLYGNAGQLISTNNGADWTYVKNEAFAYIIASRIYSFDGALFREKFDFQGSGTTNIEKSTNNGDSWEADTVNLPVNVLKYPVTNGMFLSNGKLYVYMNKQGEECLMVKDHAGSTWQKVPNTSSTLPSFPNQLIATNSDIFVSVYNESVWSTQASSTGLSDIMRNQALQVKLYPNPASGQVKVSLPGAKGMIDIELLTVSGQRVSGASIPQGGTFSLEGAAPGMYFVKVRCGEHTGVTKLMVGQ